MYPTIRFEEPSNDTIVAVNANAAVDLMGGSFIPRNRQGFVICNPDPVANVFIVVQKVGVAGPSGALALTTTSYHFKIPPSGSLPIQGGKATTVWAINDAVDPTNVRFFEVE